MTRKQVQAAIPSAVPFTLRMADGNEQVAPHPDYLLANIFKFFRRLPEMIGVFISFLALALTTGCLNTRPLGPVNISEPGWQIKEGQAVWKMKKTAPELAGEVLLATREDGRSYLQFTKTPFPFVIAQLTTNSWQFELPTQNRRYSGPGKGPARMPWLRLPGLLRGDQPPKGWNWQIPEPQHWRLENRSSGEFLEGFFSP